MAAASFQQALDGVGKNQYQELRRRPRKEIGNAEIEKEHESESEPEPGRDWTFTMGEQIKLEETQGSNRIRI